MKIKDKIYIAGFCDGEGCFTIKKNGNSWTPVASIANTNKEILAWIQSVCGKKMNARLYPQKARGNQRPWYALRFGTRATRSFITEIFPYLKLKREVAELVMNFPLQTHSGYGRAFVPDIAGLANQKSVADKIHLLNKRGTKS